MKAFQVWMVAREPATLQELGRVMLRESDSRENCEIYNEALTVADKVNLARSYFGRAVHARKPLYVVQTLPNNCLLHQSLEKQMEALGARMFLSPEKIRANVDLLDAVVRVNLAELKCDPLPPIRAAAPWIEGEVVPSPQLCQCGPQRYVMPGSGRCGRCGRAIK